VRRGKSPRLRGQIGLVVSLLGLLVILGASRSPAATNGLVAAYGFNEGSGTTVADSSGNNNRGTLSGATWTPSGRFGKALSFAAGQSAYVSVVDSASLHLTTAMTLEAWVRPTTVSGSWRTVIFKERPSGMTYALYANDGSNRPDGQVYTTAERDSVGTASLPLNTWTHLATTYDGAALKLYVNGTQVASVPASGSIVSSNGLLKIGGNAI